jgi:tetratricopeptide (TPR) repeat protein
LMIANCSIGFASWFVGENERAREHFEKSFALYDPKTDAALAHSYVYEFGSFSRIILGLANFCLGFPDTAVRVADEGVRLARTLNQPHSAMFALTVRFMILALRRDVAAVVKSADECRAEFGLVLSRHPGTIIGSTVRGWALAQMGNIDEGLKQMQHSVELWKQTRTEYNLPFLSSLLAETYLACGRLDESAAILDEQLSGIDRTGQDQWRSLLLWLKGDLLLARGAPDITGAEHYYLQAIEAAQTQSAKSWELRAAIRLARLHLSQDRAAEARSVLAPVLGWFTEGFDTALTLP